MRFASEKRLLLHSNLCGWCWGISWLCGHATRSSTLAILWFRIEHGNLHLSNTLAYFAAKWEL
jgi:protein-disulfide isomerase-like protein with CxxC motif